MQVLILQVCTHVYAWNSYVCTLYTYVDYYQRIYLKLFSALNTIPFSLF
jgi:hypothetical protein